MNKLMFELRLVLHSRLAAGSLLLLMLVAIAAVASGMHAVSAQRAALERIASVQSEDVAAVAVKYAQGGEAGYAGYSTPHLTVNPPSSLAFAAFGQRDVQPFALRVRLLGLQAQLYESESVNPELAAPGRLDFAFVLVYLAPLIVIALTHDLLTGERESGRLRLLHALPVPAGALWRRRLGLRYALVAGAVLLPLIAGALLSGASVGGIAIIAICTLLYLGFWLGLAAWVAGRARSSATSAALLLAAFVLLTLVLPTLVNTAIVRVLPVSRGVELSLAQRQAVHQGWDLPKEETFARFFRTHPEWKDTPPVTGRFHWKWYYAMQQAGDDAVWPQVKRYRQDLMEREAWTERAGWLLAPVAVQVLLHRVAHSDLQAQLDFQARVTAFHTTLRHFYYPYIFHERPFGPAEFARMPRFAPAADAAPLPIAALAGLALLAAAMLAAGLRKLGTDTI